MHIFFCESVCVYYDPVFKTYVLNVSINLSICKYVLFLCAVYVTFAFIYFSFYQEFFLKCQFI